MGFNGFYWVLLGFTGFFFRFRVGPTPETPAQPEPTGAGEKWANGPSPFHFFFGCCWFFYFDFDQFFLVLFLLQFLFDKKRRKVKGVNSCFLYLVLPSFSFWSLFEFTRRTFWVLFLKTKVKKMGSFLSRYVNISL